ncbi:matrixin family metalloprotease [Nocardioides lianchengensis]|uniref:Matrixin n=1 Tax=Nocardioides lianchengensis TaxID=1045774 RepID=A0A1G6ZGJ1_9ACTN|nr:matrixin family metalloprotease [Nocardioides lianchengensis]NYG11382.1 hypothetical protein [Nocardioides lianchengensis]SDE01804.1 Matrixin [Nocardioides lianchengensis]
MERRLRELDRLDEQFGLGEHQVHRPVGAPIPLPRGRRARKVRRERKARGPVVPGLLIVGLIMAGVFLVNPSDSGRRLRELVGFDGRLGELVGVPDGDGEYAFATTQPGDPDEPVSWNPCRPIRYVVNPAGAPDNWEDLLAGSITAISDATGFQFEDTGTSDERDFDDRIDGLNRPQPVLIGWADEEEVPRLAGNVAGLGGSTYLERQRHRTYVTGAITLDSELFAELAEERNGDALMQAIITHELGHVVGLDHVDDDNELMYADNVGQTELGPGDLEGLARLGSVDCA